MASSNEYYKHYRRGERELKSGEREDLIDKKFVVEFKSKKSSIPQFKKFYKDKIKTKEQELIFNNCLDALQLIESCKKGIELEGLYTKNVTGNLKINPLNKELRDNILSFTKLLYLLHDLLEPDDSSNTKKKENKFIVFAK
ncbi:hypothetical protein KD33_07820 [Clostridium sp. NCR]|nr:hypothetical protein KD33_07820 [Clostridium sp. NCR]